MKVYAPDDFGAGGVLAEPVRKGDEIEVDAEVGERLVEQGWTSARQKAAQKVARQHRKEDAAEVADEPVEVEEAPPAPDEEIR